MSRRKQAKPRSLKHGGELCGIDDNAENVNTLVSSPSSSSSSSFNLQYSDRKSRKTNLNNEEQQPALACVPEACVQVGDLMSMDGGLNGGLGTPISWRSSDTPEEGMSTPSLSPTSCTTNLSDQDGSPQHQDFSYTIGVTENTPYGCHFCEKAFPRLSYLKRHEQVHSDQMPFKCDFCQRLFKHKRSRDRHVKLHTGDRKYKCNLCESAFSRSDHLKIHMKTHDNGKPYQCTVCNRGYNTAAALTSHMQNHKKDESSTAQHQQQQKFRCLQCSASFQTSEELHVHIAKHDGRRSESPSQKGRVADEPLKKQRSQKPEFQCDSCRQQFASLESLKQHLKTHEDSTSGREVESLPAKFPCVLCSEREFCTFSALENHMKQFHAVSDRERTSTPTSGSPFPSDLETSRYSCEYCPTKYSSIQALQRHTVAEHSLSTGNSIGGSTSPCHVSADDVPAAKLERELGGGAVPTTPKDPTDKKPQHAKSKSCSPRQHNIPDMPIYSASTPHFPIPGTLLCSQCSAAFPDFESFRTHLKSHLDAVVTKFNCTECDGEFPSEELLSAHVTSHYLVTSTEYGCQCCPRLFAKPDQLQKHLMDIHAHQLYRCSLCKEVFDSKVSIQVHFAVRHSNECRLYKCTACNAVFRSELEFQLHVRTVHLSKVQPYRCYLCDMLFVSEIQLHLHLQEHKKQFACVYCNEAFHVEFLLDRHMEEAHSGETGINGVDAIQNLSLKPKSDTESRFSSSGKQVHCDICDAVFTSESSLNIHRKQVHNIRTTGTQKPGQATLSLFCAYCNESCKSRTELENHMKAHTVSPTKHKCNICDEVCPSVGTLAEHKLSHCKVVSGNTCVTCHAMLKTKDDFYGHMRQHSAQGLPSPCVVCRQTLVTEVEVQVHASYHLKNSDPVYSCCVCGQQSTIQQLIITGTQESHSYMCKNCFHAKGDDFLRCLECMVKFESFSELEKHVSAHRKTYQCIKCQMSFESEAAIQVHVASHVLQEGTNHACHLCPKVFDSPAKLQCHLIEHTFEGSSSYSCYMCSAAFTAPNMIQQHMLEHGLDSRPYDCGQCHQKFFFRTELDNHKVVHQQSAAALRNELCRCADCDRLFPTAFEMRTHLCSGDQKSGGFKCSHCEEAFDTSSEMQQHCFRLHGEEEMDVTKSFRCPECDKEFSSMTNLQGHVRVHKQGQKHTCPQCNKHFAVSRNLIIHMRTHSGEKPYECPVCKKRFAKRENRKAHLKSHIGHKPFTCPHCRRTFSRKSHVKEHMRIHITSTTYPCELCTETFASINDLRCHSVEAHHKRFDHCCSVCSDVFEHAEELDEHMNAEHDVRSSNSFDESSPTDGLSESSLGQSSSSGDNKDADNSISSVSSLAEDSATRDSPVSATDYQEKT